MVVIRNASEGSSVNVEWGRSRSHITAALFLAAASLMASYVVHAGDLGKVVAFDIKAQTLDKALLEFGTQAHVQIMFAWTSQASHVTINVLRGTYTVRVALTSLLGGTGLGFIEHGNTIEIIPTPRARQPLANQTSNSDPPTPEHDPLTQGGTRSAIPDDRPSSKRPQSNISLHEVVITGTHIAGIATIASPVSTYSKQYIYSSGAESIGEFINQLPANFSETSEMNASTTPSGPGATINDRVGAVGFDIHGLGVQSTLVLVNGHRMAPGNLEGNFVDVSILPLSAIERIDIVKDSASAVYGSDAVGGVVNIITIPRFKGSETSARYGKVTQGGRSETTASETVGTSWTQGAAALSYELGDETPLESSSRSFSEFAPSPFSLLPEQTRHSFYGTITQSLPDNLVLNGFVLYGHRKLEDSYFTGPRSVIDSDVVDSTTAVFGLDKDFASGAVASGSIEYSMDDARHMAALGSQSTPPKYAPYANQSGKTRLWALNLDYSGGVSLPHGTLARYAIGGQARKEKLSYTDYLPYSAYRPDRTVVSEYIEVHVSLARSVGLTAAYRHERYSDFGSTDNPKLGVEWMPKNSISVSATYSTAFRAPALFDMNPAPTEGVYITLPDPLKGGLVGGCALSPGPHVGCTPALILFGGNQNLKPETAKSWTATVAVHPSTLKGLNLSLSFYDVKYYNRINNLSTALASPFNALEDENELGDSIVHRDLPNAEIQQLAQSSVPHLFDFTGVVPASVTTLVDARSLNLSRLSTRGLDLGVSYSRLLSSVTVSSEFEGTRILQYANQFTQSTPAIGVLNTAYEPVSLKLRLREMMSYRRLTAGLVGHYTGSYTNNAVAPAGPIASWVTVDAMISYRLPINVSSGGSGDVTIGCLNVADRNPPFVSNPNYRINFDGTNATPLGRFVYAGVRIML